MMDKEYFINYYKNHKKEYRKRDKRWRKNNPEKVKAIKERYLEKYLGKRKKSINKTDYGKVGLRALYIKQYGKNLESKIDNITHLKCKKRRFCLECTLDKKECPGWENCIHKKETLEIINS